MKTLLALFILIAPVQAQSHPSHWQQIKQHLPLIGGYAAVGVAALMDWRTTEQCVQLPGNVCAEGNPILLAAGINPASAHGSQQLLGFKLGLIGGAIAGGELMRRTHWVSERHVSAALWSAAMIQGGVDWHNRQLTRQLAVPCPATVCAP